MTYPYKTITEYGNLLGKRVVLRLDLNVSIQGGKVFDDFRIQKSLPVLQLLTSGGAKVIIVAHIQSVETDSLAIVHEYMKALCPWAKSFDFVTEPIESVGERVASMVNGGIVLLENIRRYEGEEKNDPALAKSLAALGDIYVNEAFSVSHRKHASIVGVPQYIPSFAGPLFDEEVRSLSKAFDPEKPFLFILGGAKFQTKMPLLEKFLTIADTVYVAGALANDCYKAQGLPVGQSTVSDAAIDLGPILASKKVAIPVDGIVLTGATDQAPGQNVVKYPTRPGEILETDRIYDAGPQALADLQVLVSQARFILWNGPLGNYELGYTSSTLSLAKMIAASDATTIVGGGDTLGAIAELGLNDRFTFLSTAGGAMLDFLANESLPGIDALGKGVVVA